MRAGELRHRLTIQEPDEVDDTVGGRAPQPPPGGDGTGWKGSTRVRAKVKPLSSRELIQDGRVVMGHTHEVRLRYPTPASVDKGTSFLFGTRRLHVVSVINDGERNRELVCLCEERS
jgi:SPP1 family predicted phage head-tail adaptor